HTRLPRELGHAVGDVDELYPVGRPDLDRLGARDEVAALDRCLARNHASRANRTSCHDPPVRSCPDPARGLLRPRRSRTCATQTLHLTEYTAVAAINGRT